jgi:hypothetical protein
LPYSTVGFAAPPGDAESPSPLPQVREYYQVAVLPAVRQHAADGYWRTFVQRRLPRAADVALPAHAMFVLIPMGVAALFERRTGRRGETAEGEVARGRFALVLGAAALPAAYAFWAMGHAHYWLTTTPGFVVLAFMGVEFLRRRVPALGPAVTLTVAALVVGNVPLAGHNLDMHPQFPYLANANTAVAKLEHRPAVVLFPYHFGERSFDEEPVYNLDTASPDDAAVVRAQDLGAEANQRLFRYFAQRSPERFIYRYENGRMTPLGFVKDLAGRR